MKTFSSRSISSSMAELMASRTVISVDMERVARVRRLEAWMGDFNEHFKCLVDDHMRILHDCVDLMSLL
jgi:hypothetical protein